MKIDRAGADFTGKECAMVDMSKLTTYHTVFIDGIPIGIPNLVMDSPNGDFHVSYNNKDIKDYGCDTTALVLGNFQNWFYILNGDHRPQYEALIPQGFDACFQYFKDHIDQINKRSDKP